MRSFMTLLWAAALTMALVAGLVVVRQAGMLRLHHAIPGVDEAEICELQSAVGLGDLAAAERVLEKKPDLANCVCMGGWRPIHEAARAGDIPMAKLLISKGADLDATTGDGDTALDCAVSSGEVRMIAFLLRRGCTSNRGVALLSRRSTGVGCITLH